MYIWLKLFFWDNIDLASQLPEVVLKFCLVNRLSLNAPCVSGFMSLHISFPLHSLTMVWHTCLFDMLSPSNLLSAQNCLSLSGIASQLEEPESDMRIQRRVSLHFAPMTELQSLCDYIQLFTESASCSHNHTLLDNILERDGYKEGLLRFSWDNQGLVEVYPFFDILKLFKPSITWMS